LKFIRLSKSDDKLIVVQDNGVDFSTDFANVTFASDQDELTPKSIDAETTPKS
jgi:hypothetical protein